MMHLRIRFSFPAVLGNNFLRHLAVYAEAVSVTALIGYAIGEVAGVDALQWGMATFTGGLLLLLEGSLRPAPIRRFAGFRILMAYVGGLLALNHFGQWLPTWAAIIMAACCAVALAVLSRHAPE